MGGHFEIVQVYSQRTGPPSLQIWLGDLAGQAFQDTPPFSNC